jgi:hypothetical protein
MTRLASAILAIAVLAAAHPLAQAELTGEWEVRLTTPGGPIEFEMYLDQKDSALSGRMTNPSGEFPLAGTVKGDQVTLSWTLPDGAEFLDIVFTGRIVGEAIRGNARLGRLGNGAMSATRAEF